MRLDSFNDGNFVDIILTKFFFLFLVIIYIIKIVKQVKLFLTLRWEAEGGRRAIERFLKLLVKFALGWVWLKADYCELIRSENIKTKLYFIQKQSD